jgi:soluble lytic murein transglycosylase
MMTRYRTSLALTMTAAATALLVGAAAAASQRHTPVPKARSAVAKSTPAKAAIPAKPTLLRSVVPLAPVPAPGEAVADLATVKQAFELIRRGKPDGADDLKAQIRDPVARKLVEWAVLRSDDTQAGFERYLAFMTANPSWPSAGIMRRRAERTLWEERRDAATVRNFFATTKPLTAPGRFALARALLAAGDRTGAQYYVREAWRNDLFGSDLESDVLETFPDLLTRADHRARADRRLYDNDNDTALRSAARAGGAATVIAKARMAVANKAANAEALLDAVPEEARDDVGYRFSRIQWLRRNDRVPEAVRLMLAAPRDPQVLGDLDEWWVERRLLAREMLDAGDPQTAYRIARDAAAPPRENYRGEQEFTAGWIALRFLNNPQTALAHFARIGRDTANQITLARASYWQGRATEALGRQQEARTHYEAAARYPTAYYGQIARARLGLGEIALRHPPEPDVAQRRLEVVRALEMLYAANESGLIIAVVADLAERINDISTLAALGEVAARHQDARAMLLLGKTAQQRGFALDHYAFPNVGVPQFGAVGPEVDRSVVYAIVRQESAFNQAVVSTANALGLMQVTPEAGRYVAKKFSVNFDLQRLRSDPVYNSQMGAAEIGDLLKDYRGSYILSFAGYNAGRGRVRQWVGRYGDPRDPEVDPIDWVERIPFSETRNYVQRVMENLQVYRVRMGQGQRLLIEADLRRGST